MIVETDAEALADQMGEFTHKVFSEVAPEGVAHEDPNNKISPFSPLPYL